MPRIFISYRRADSTTITGRIYDSLVREFGTKSVFMDRAKGNIPAGRDFRGVLKEQLVSCHVIIVVIGPMWLGITDDLGRRRLNEADDYVRIEVETGLQRDIFVIPVLVNNALMPNSKELPLSIAELASRQAVTVRDDPDFLKDIELLIIQIRQRFKSRKIIAFSMLITFLLVSILLIPTSRIFSSSVLASYSPALPMGEDDVTPECGLSSVTTALSHTNIDDFNNLKILPGHNQEISHLKFHKNLGLTSQSIDGTGIEWNLGEGYGNSYSSAYVPTSKTHAISPNGDIFALADTQGNISLFFDTDITTPHVVLQGHSAQITSLTFNSSGSILASASYDSTVRLWEIPSGKPLAVLTHRGINQPKVAIGAVTFNPNGVLLVTGTSDGQIWVWDAATGHQLRILKRHSAPVKSLSFNPQGTLLASGAEDFLVMLWGVCKPK